MPNTDKKWGTKAKKSPALIASLILIGLSTIALQLFNTYNFVTAIQASIEIQRQKDAKDADDSDTAKIGNKSYTIEIADSDSERILGLSGRESLDQDKALVFVFEEEALHGIWMKDMRFNIDIVWLDSSGKVVGLKEDAKLDSYPEIYYPDTDALYVIELASGQASASGLGLGDKVAVAWQ